MRNISSSIGERAKHGTFLQTSLSTHCLAASPETHQHHHLISLPATLHRHHSPHQQPRHSQVSEERGPPHTTSFPIGANLDRYIRTIQYPAIQLSAAVIAVIRHFYPPLNPVNTAN